MIIPPIRVWAGGDVLTAAQMNTYISNAVTFFDTPPYCLMSNWGLVGTGDAPNTNVTTTAPTGLLLFLVSKDTDSMTPAVLPASSFTIRTTGCYWIQADAYNTLTLTQSHAYSLAVNNQIVCSWRNASTGNTSAAMNVARYWQVTVGDIVSNAIQLGAADVPNKVQAVSLTGLWVSL